MTERRFYIGSLGPFFYEDTDTYPTPDAVEDQGFGDGVTMETAVSEGTATFDGMSLGIGELTAGSINRASGTLTLEVGGVAQVSIATTGVTITPALILSACAAAGADVDKFLVLDGSNNVDYRTGADVLADLSGDASAAFDWNSQNLTGVGSITCNGLNIVCHNDQVICHANEVVLS